MAILSPQASRQPQYFQTTHLIMNKLILSLAILASSFATLAQPLKPGFSKAEYLECLSMASHMDSLSVDSKYLSPAPKSFHKVYVSPNVGFDNAWELWQDDKTGVMAIMMRATVSTTISWGANFNAAMVRAVGVTHVGTDKSYDLCADSLACVHAGWVAGLMTMADDMFAHLDSCVKAGRRDFLISGHSQGGALAYLVTAMLRRAQAKGLIPQDVRFKTYTSAAPKPGDYLFALNYEAMTQQGWSFSVVNADDWVPETPLSLQRPVDFRPTNPFSHMDEMLAKLRPIQRLKIKVLYSKLSNPVQTEVENWTKYLGKTLGGMLEEQKAWFCQPDYVECVNFARTGNFVVLLPDAEYYSAHPAVADDAFEHHQYNAYYDLAVKLPE